MDSWPVPDLALTGDGPRARSFLALGIGSLHGAFDHVRRLPYAGNSSRTDPGIVLSEGRGTCCTKHALLAELGSELGLPELALVQCMFRMDDRTVPGIGAVLERFDLDWIPESHDFLRWRGEAIDVSSIRLGSEYLEHVLEERVVAPSSIVHEKVADHRQYVDEWRRTSPDARGIDEATFWRAREACVVRLRELLGP